MNCFKVKLKQSEYLMAAFLIIATVNNTFIFILPQLLKRGTQCKQGSHVALTTVKGSEYSAAKC